LDLSKVLADQEVGIGVLCHCHVRVNVGSGEERRVEDSGVKRSMIRIVNDSSVSHVFSENVKEPEKSSSRYCELDDVRRFE
jgi:hypothetical protein